MKQSFIAITIILLYSCGGRSLPRTGMEGKLLPFYDVQLPDSTHHFNTADIPSDKPIALFIFSPYCPICRAQMQNILSNKNELDNIRFYLLTDANFKDMKAFYDHFHLQNYQLLTVGWDTANLWEKYFHMPGVPYTAIYTPQKRLKQVLMGMYSVSTIERVAFE